MNPLPSDDPLVALWQTAPKPDTHNLLANLQHIQKSHRRLNRTMWTIMIGIAVLLIFEEATGRVRLHGILSAVWTLGLVVGAFWQRRAQCNRTDALTFDTVSLLKFMVARAKSDLLVARCLYAGVPCGALLGFGVAKLARSGAPQPTNVSSVLATMQTSAGVGALVIMVIAGAVLARSRHLLVRELSGKLKSITVEL